LKNYYPGLIGNCSTFEEAVAVFIAKKLKSGGITQNANGRFEIRKGKKVFRSPAGIKEFSWVAKKN
jgi:hypothetical protein